MFQTGIVVYSSRHDAVRDGQVLNGSALIHRARTDLGMAVLPYELGRELEYVGGYFRRGWGDSGWPIQRTIGVRICPMLIRVEPDRSFVYWTAVVAKAGPNPSGVVRLVSDSSFPGTQSAALGAGQDDVHLERLTYDEDGVAVVGGKRRVSVQQGGFLALNLYATASDATVLVSAVSQSAIDVAYP